jgi:hypothetical protein
MLRVARWLWRWQARVAHMSSGWRMYSTKVVLGEERERERER